MFGGAPKRPSCTKRLAKKPRGVLLAPFGGCHDVHHDRRQTHRCNERHGRDEPPCHMGPTRRAAAAGKIEPRCASGSPSGDRLWMRRLHQSLRQRIDPAEHTQISPRETATAAARLG